MNIYDKIDARIKELGIKKAHVSTSLGMSRAWLNSAQAYQTYLPPATLDKIAAILQTTKEELLDGVDMKTLSELLGHYDVAFTIRTYGHTDLTTKKHALEKMYGTDMENE